jgi:hypothetical protein
VRNLHIFHRPPLYVAQEFGMKEFACPRCEEAVFFNQCECVYCGNMLAFDATDLKITCLNRNLACANRGIIGCNWKVEDGRRLCRSCSLTRTIPYLGVERNVLLWRRVEEAKRWLIYDLCRLPLPLAPQSGPGVAFDILSDDACPIMTGHMGGLITLSLAEADDVEREARRVTFREPYRTLLGHFRHEVGHFYWQALVAETKMNGPFKVVFDDPGQDYAAALTSYYNRTNRAYDRKGFISEYATSHPWEDWAETFAHFLHIVSTLDSVAELPLPIDPRFRQTLEDPYRENDFEVLLASWMRIARSINKLNRSLGLNDAYPFELSQIVTGKLHFVHMSVHHFRNVEQKRQRRP